MTRQENILTLNEHLDHWKRLLSEKICDQSEGEKTIDALQNAIKALGQQPCEDVISRQAVYEIINDAYFLKLDDGAALQESIHQLPPVTPQPKMGQWIFDEVLDHHYYCSECKAMGVDYWDYCPVCGVKMQEVEE